ncbi:MAG: 4'-phosphopantetheinyl transferase superfamily protein [Bacteroidales bacterium]|nr:4'-phosphopantetheinyl transferase superfamily protein [Bacteroidales bacterium]
MTETLLFDDMAQCSPEMVEHLLPLVSEQRKEEALRFRHLFGQFACLKSYVMLRELLEKRGLRHPFLFQKNEHGKPSLVGHPEIHFNISHCKAGIAVAVSDAPVGIDIESYREAHESLVRYTMNEEEQSVIEASDDPIRTFTEYWTRKEAVFKLRGTGIMTVEIKDLLQGDEVIETQVNAEKGYVYSIATNKKG